MATEEDVAKWMAGEVKKTGILDQGVAANTILAKYGEEFTYINENGNLAISRKVLSSFRKLTGDDVVWVRSDRLWRKRQSWDPKSGRMQET